MPARTRPRPGLQRIAAALLALTLLAACTAEEPESDLVVGVGSTVEQQVLAALTVVALEHAGITVDVRTGLGDTLALRRQARAGMIDLYWDYTGAAWALGLDQENPPSAPRESFERVREADAANGLAWLEPTAANATLTFFVRAGDLPDAPADDLAWLAGKLSTEARALCVDEDFRNRPGGLQQLATEYYQMSLDRVELVSADEDEAIAHVAAGRCFAGLATATTGAAYRAGLAPVEDRLGVFPAFVVAPVMRADTLEAQPGVVEALAPVVERLDTRALGELNARVAEAEPEELAREFLADVVEPRDA
jgi:osmoprotectant transport system substrate-binding protein